MNFGETSPALTVAVALLLAVPSAMAQAELPAPDGLGVDPTATATASALSGEVLTRLQAELRLSGFAPRTGVSTPAQVTLSASKGIGTDVFAANIVVSLRAEHLEVTVAPSAHPAPLVFAIAYSKESPNLVAIKAVDALERMFAERPTESPTASERESVKNSDARPVNAARPPEGRAQNPRSWRVAAGSGVLWLPSLGLASGTLTVSIAKHFRAGWILQLSPSASYSDAEVRAASGRAQLAGQLGLFELGYGARAANWTVSGLMGFGAYRLSARGESVPPGRGRTVTLVSGASSVSAQVSYALREAWALKATAGCAILTPKPVVRLLTFRDSVQPLLGASLSVEYRL